MGRIKNTIEFTLLKYIDVLEYELYRAQNKKIVFNKKKHSLYMTTIKVDIENIILLLQKIKDCDIVEK